MFSTVVNREDNLGAVQVGSYANRNSLLTQSKHVISDLSASRDWHLELSLKTRVNSIIEHIVSRVCEQ